VSDVVAKSSDAGALCLLHRDDPKAILRRSKSGCEYLISPIIDCTELVRNITLNALPLREGIAIVWVVRQARSVPMGKIKLPSELADGDKALAR